MTCGAQLATTSAITPPKTVLPDGLALVAFRRPTSSSAAVPVATSATSSQSGYHGANCSSTQSTATINPAIEIPVTIGVPSIKPLGERGGRRGGGPSPTRPSTAGRVVRRGRHRAGGESAELPL